MAQRAPALLGALALAACAAHGPVATRATESLLAQAGFRQVAAATPEAAQPAPFVLSPQVGADGAARYWFSDPDYCRCAYVGDDAALAKFQELQRRQRQERGNGEPAFAAPGLEPLAAPGL